MEEGPPLEEIVQVTELLSYRKSADALQVVIRHGCPVWGSELNFQFGSGYITPKPLDSSGVTIETFMIGDSRSYVAEYTNSRADREAILGFSSKYGGAVVTIRAESPDKNFYVMKDCFLAALHDVSVKHALCFPGMQRNSAGNGGGLFRPATVHSRHLPAFLNQTCLHIELGANTSLNQFWIQAGTVTMKQLEEGESLVVQLGNLVCWEEEVAVALNSDHRTLLLHNLLPCNVKGPGRVWISTSSRHEFWNNETGGVVGKPRVQSPTMQAQALASTIVSLFVVWLVYTVIFEHFLTVEFIEGLA
jgi:uncharacterized protein (AIM24 family)